ncbi:pilin [Pseudomonas aeruginosa]|uniref:pilin n=1 Tax=Pseudomonas TaxID=286 RepID=UPI0039E1DE79
MPNCSAATSTNARLCTSLAWTSFGNGASAAISGQTLTWTRDVNGGWSCATTVDAKFRPNGCTD